MRSVLWVATAAVALALGVAADPLDDAKSAMAALDRGDSATAIRLFTQALQSGGLDRSDQELAHVKRAEAYLAAGDAKSALADANQALDIDPRDGEAEAAADRSRTLLNAAPIAPSGPGVAALDEAMAKYEAQKKVEAEQYAAQVAAYDAKLRAQESTRDAQVAAWRADVQACKAGDTSKCGAAARGLPGEARPAQAAEVLAPGVQAPVVSWSHTVYSGNTIIATLVTPLANRMKFIAADSAWDCTGMICVASDAPDTAKGVAGCAALTRTVGKIASYAADATALDASELARCGVQQSTASR